PVTEERSAAGGGTSRPGGIGPQAESCHGPAPGPARGRRPRACEGLRTISRAPRSTPRASRPDERVVRRATTRGGPVFRPRLVGGGRDRSRRGSPGRAAPVLRVIQVGIVDLPILVDELVAEGD